MELIDKLFTKYYNEGVLYLYTLTKNYQLSEDLAVDAFYKSISTIDSVDGFKYYYLKVCKNLFIDYYRKHKREVIAEVDVCDQESNVLDRLIKTEKNKALLEAVSILKKEHNEVIVLFYFNNLSIKEISKVINKTENNVKVLLHRARIELKNILEVNYGF